MLLYFLFIFSIYYIFILLLIFGWSKLSTPDQGMDAKEIPFVSIIIAVRNEENNIPQLLGCITKQTLAVDQFELIIVDDGSTDNTANSILKFIDQTDVNVRLLESKFQPGSGRTPKKEALRTGIEASKGDIILMTDGDCWFGERWLESMTLRFKHEHVMFVAGPVALTGEGQETFLSKIQTIEFSSLLGSGGALLQLNYPLMCNGANLAFRKKAFYKVNGYEGFEENSSGDDVFLMQKIHLSFKNSIVFQKDPLALVYSYTQPTFADLINQRKRWASKWNSYPLRLSWVLPVFLFVHYISFIACFASLFLFPQDSWIIGFLLAIKIILDYRFLKNIMTFCNLRFKFWIFLVSEFLYPFYALLIGTLVHFGDYKWKGRRYKI